MKALILAAGKGSRLGAITSDVPKVLLPIKGQPLLDILIRKLINLNFESIIINTFYKAKMVEDFLMAQDYNSLIQIAPEQNLLGTAGTLKNNLSALCGDNFLVMHGDNYFYDDLKGLLNFHISDKSKSLMTMGTFISQLPEQCGVVEVNRESFITNFYEKAQKPPTNIANSAIYVFRKESKKIISKLTPKETDISLHLIPKFLGQCKSFQLSGEFIDIGTPERYYLVKS